MKPFLLALLAVSLAANVVLALRTWHVASPSAATDPSSGPLSSSSPASPAQAKTGDTAPPSARGAGTGLPADSSSASATALFAWRPDAPIQDLHDMVAKLRAAGFPPTVVRAVISQLLNERLRIGRPDPDQPYWKQLAAPTPKTQAAQLAAMRERQALYEELLGADSRPSAALDAAERFRRYGNLSDDKVDAIARIVRDYGEMAAEAYAQRRGSTTVDMQAMMQAQQLMDKEKLADIAAILTPEELAQYEMRNSSSARALINNLRNVEVNEQEYTRLYEAQLAFDTANPRQATMDVNSYAQRQVAQLALNEQMRAVLGENRFFSYLEANDGSYANIVRTLSTFPAVTPAVSYQVYQLQTELQNAMTQSAREGRSAAERGAEMRATVEKYNGRLEALIGPAAADVYRKQGNGRMFLSSRTVSTTVQPAGR